MKLQRAGVCGSRFSKRELREMSKLAVIALLIEICVQPGHSQQCSADRLPDFRDTVPRRIPERDRFQAIVPAYRFQCSGRVTKWVAFVQPGGDNEEYYIQFQVWRPTGTEGCYELVGYNEPPVEEGSEYGMLNPVGGCVVLTVRENEQIDFQLGDVVGYYVDYFVVRGEDASHSGIQWIEDSELEVIVHYRDDLPREDIKSQYALNGTNPTECGFPVSDANIHTLNDSVTSAPIISLSLAMTTPVPLPSPSSSSRPVVASSTPTAPSVAPSATMTTPVTLLSSSSSSSRVVLSTPTAPSVTPSTTVKPSTSFSCSSGVPLDTENVCGDTQDDNRKRNIPIIPATVAILIIIIAIIAISVVLWLGKRKRDVTDHSADDILESNSAYNSINVMDTNDSHAASNVPTSPNIAYQTPSRKSVDISMSANEAYVSTDIPTSANPAYLPLKQPIQSNNDSVYEYVFHN